MADSHARPWGRRILSPRMLSRHEIVRRTRLECQFLWHDLLLWICDRKWQFLVPTYLHRSGKTHWFLADKTLLLRRHHLVAGNNRKAYCPVCHPEFYIPDLYFLPLTAHRLGAAGQRQRLRKYLYRSSIQTLRIRDNDIGAIE